MTAIEIYNYFTPPFFFSLFFSITVFSFFLLTKNCNSENFFYYFLVFFLSIFFISLTHYPFPDSTTFDCSNGGAKPILRPFATIDHLLRLWSYTRNDSNSRLSLWYGSKVIQAATMNFLLCAAIGAFMTKLIGPPLPFAKVFGFGVLLSGSVEVSQLTGLFGLYSCAWRQFEVDDLILNITGLMTGFAIMRHIRQKS
jgi:glycopeptide antibiotics resistance protein